MSLRPTPGRDAPAATAAIALAAFPHDSLHLRLNDHLGTIFSEAQFVPLVALCGQSAGLAAHRQTPMLGNARLYRRQVDLLMHAALCPPHDRHAAAGRLGPAQCTSLTGNNGLRLTHARDYAVVYLPANAPEPNSEEQCNAVVNRAMANGEQATRQKNVTLALGAGFLDLDRKGLLGTLHLIDGFGLGMTLTGLIGRRTSGLRIGVTYSRIL